MTPLCVSVCFKSSKHLRFSLQTLSICRGHRQVRFIRPVWKVRTWIHFEVEMQDLLTCSPHCRRKVDFLSPGAPFSMPCLFLSNPVWESSRTKCLLYSGT